MVFELRAETGNSRGSIARVGQRLGINAETLGNWVNKAEVDSGQRSGTTSDDRKRISELERENRELRRGASAGEPLRYLPSSCSSVAQTLLLVTSSKDCGTGRCSRRRNSQYRGTPSSRQRRMSSAAISTYAPVSGRLHVCSPFGKLCNVTRPGCVVPNV